MTAPLMSCERVLSRRGTAMRWKEPRRSRGASVSQNGPQGSVTVPDLVRIRMWCFGLLLGNISAGRSFDADLAIRLCDLAIRLCDLACSGAAERRRARGGAVRSGARCIERAGGAAADRKSVG